MCTPYWMFTCLWVNTPKAGIRASFWCLLDCMNLPFGWNRSQNHSVSSHSFPRQFMPFDNWSHWAVTDGVVGKWDYTPFNVTATRESHAFKILLLHDPTPPCTLRCVIKMEQGGHLVSPGPHLQSAFPSCLTTKLQLLVYDSQETTWIVSSTRTSEPPWPFSCQRTHVLPVLYEVLLRMCGFGGGQKQIGEDFHIKSSCYQTVLGLFRPQSLEFPFKMVVDWRN